MFWFQFGKYLRVAKHEVGNQLWSQTLIPAFICVAKGNQLSLNVEEREEIMSWLFRVCVCRRLTAYKGGHYS